MELFLHNITSFPMVVYTFLLAIIICYWLLAMIGAVDIEIFDADIDLDIEVDGDMGIDIDSDTQGLSGVTGFMLKFGLTGVPVTVVISLLVASAWLICYLLATLILTFIPTTLLKTLVGAALIIVSFGLAIPVTALFIKPFKGIFTTYSAAGKASFIGRECVVKTGQVNPTFGQAELDDGGAGMLFDVRAESAQNIKKGDAVILQKYDVEEGSFWVIKTAELDKPIKK